MPHDPDNPVAVAMIGVGGFGRWTLQALQQSPAVRLVGLFDREPTIAEQAGQETGAAAYTDARRLLAETRPAAVFLAVPPHVCGDLIELCVKQGIHVWKELPLGRNLEEAARFVQQMDAAGLLLSVGTQRRFAPGYHEAWQLRRRVGRVFLGRAHYLFNWGPRLGWRGDRASAGGGALLELGYHPVDLLVWMLGMPEEVYGLNYTERRGGEAADGTPEPIYDTEDTAAGILRYPDGAMASVVTTRRSGPVSEELDLHGREGSIRATDESCVLTDPDGNVLHRTEGHVAPHEAFVRQAEAFARAVAERPKRFACSGRENLLTQATIDAMYLSARTCQPESPSRLLGTHGLTPEDCLGCALRHADAAAIED